MNPGDITADKEKKSFFLMGKYNSPAQRKKRIIISIFLFVIYLIIASILYIIIRNETLLSIAVIPLVIVGWLLGTWPPLFLGIMQWLHALILIILVGGIDLWLQVGLRGVLMPVILIIVGMLMGRLSDLNQKTMAIAKQLAKTKEEKTAYFINFAHETKTPLTLILNYLTKYMQKKGMDPDLAIISSNIQKLKKNMVNFLDYEKLEKGQAFYDHGDITDLSTTLQNSINLFKETANHKQIQINTNI